MTSSLELYRRGLSDFGIVDLDLPSTQPFNVLGVLSRQAGLGRLRLHADPDRESGSRQFNQFRLPVVIGLEGVGGELIILHCQRTIS